MKKTFKFLGLTLTVLFVFIFIACKDDPPKNDPCKCPKGTVHYGEPCDCGGENCSDNCTVKQAVDNAKFGDKDIPIYAGAGVTDEEAAAKKGDIEAALTYVSDAGKNTLKTKTQKIVIVGGINDSCDKPSGTINIGKESSQDDIRGFFNSIVVPAFTKFIDNSKKTVRMAFAAVNSKGNAKSI